MIRLTALIVPALLLAACETPTTQRYAISADNNVAIRATGATGVAIKPFTGPAEFNSTCRVVTPLQVADNLSHTQYIQKAFEDELKAAGAYNFDQARVILSGSVTKLSFSSSQDLTQGYWQIEMKLDSTNGKSMYLSETYYFNSAVNTPDACRNTADAYLRAVQNLVGKAVKSPGFSDMLKA